MNSVVPSARRPRMLILTSSFPRKEGDYAGCFVAEFAQALSKDFDVETLSPASRGAAAQECQGSVRIRRFNYFWPRRAQLLDAAIDLQPLLEKSLWARLQTAPFLLFFFLRALMTARRADIVCSHWLVPSGLIGCLIARFLGKPHIAVEHSGALHLLRKLRIGSVIAGFIARYSVKIFTVSEDLKRKFIELRPDAASKVQVLPMGVNFEQYSSLIENQKPTLNPQPATRNSKKSVLFLGRLARVKGVDVLIDALAGRTDIDLIIAGEGEQRAELERRARELNAPAQFIGAADADRKRRLLPDCDLVVIPSVVLPDGRTEGMPLVCLEAFAASKPVIASSVGGLSELIKDGETGYLCRPGDGSQLREKILDLLNDDRRRAVMGKRASLIAADHDWSKIASRFRSFIE